MLLLSPFPSRPRPRPFLSRLTIAMSEQRTKRFFGLSRLFRVSLLCGSVGLHPFWVLDLQQGCVCVMVVVVDWRVWSAGMDSLFELQLYRVTITC